MKKKTNDILLEILRTTPEPSIGILDKVGLEVLTKSALEVKFLPRN